MDNPWSQKNWADCVAINQFSLLEHPEENLSEFFLSGLGDGLQLPVGFCQAMKKRVKILELDCLLQRKITFTQDMDGKVPDQDEATADGNPEDLPLLFRRTRQEDGEFVSIKRFQPGTHFPANPSGGTGGAGLEGIVIEELSLG